MVKIIYPDGQVIEAKPSETAPKKPKTLVIYTVGPVHCSVCTNINSEKKIEEFVNDNHPTCISTKWRISKDKFRTGEPNPCPCDQQPKTHKHYLMEC